MTQKGPISRAAGGTVAVLLLFGGSPVRFSCFPCELTNELTQVLVPGRSELTLKESGSYTVFHEHESVVNGRVFSTDAGVNGMRCALIDPKTGLEVPMIPASTKTHYSLGGRSGVSVLEFNLAEPGTHSSPPPRGGTDPRPSCPGTPSPRSYNRAEPDLGAREFWRSSPAWQSSSSGERPEKPCKPLLHPPPDSGQIENQRF